MRNSLEMLLEFKPEFTKPKSEGLAELWRAIVRNAASLHVEASFASGLSDEASLP